MSKLSLLFPLLLLCCYLVSCTTLRPSPTVVTLQRSDRQAPPWISTTTDLNQNDFGAFDYIYRRDNIANINLAIKQLQRVAIFAAKEALKKAALQKIEDWAKSKESPSETSLVQARKNMLTSLAQGIKFSDEKMQIYPQNIYWELNTKTTNDMETESFSQTRYSIWILISVSRQEFDKALRMIAQSVIASKSGDTALQSACEEILRLEQL